MSSLLYGFKQAWQAEKLKIKGSHILLLTLVMGTVFPVLKTIATFFESSFNIGNAQDRLPFNFFEDEFNGSVPGFGFFFFPMALILLVARVAAIEHKTDTWKLIETQPVSRLSIWLVKWLMACLLSALVILVYLFFTILFTALTIPLQEIHDAATFGIPVWHLLYVGARLWIAGLGLLTIQLGISIIMKSTVWPIAIGVLALIITNIAGASNEMIASIWPYSITGYTSRFPDGSEMGAFLLPSEWQGLLWVLLAPLAFTLYLFRGYLRQSLSFTKPWAISIMAIVLLAMGTWWIQKPGKIALLDNRTVIAGKIEAEKFFNYYESNGWKVGKNPMKNWKAAANNWITNSNTYAKGITNNKPKLNKHELDNLRNYNYIHSTSYGEGDYAKLFGGEGTQPEFYNI